jgi:hypothetical protein
MIRLEKSTVLQIPQIVHIHRVVCPFPPTRRQNMELVCNQKKGEPKLTILRDWKQLLGVNVPHLASLIVVM